MRIFRSLLNASANRRKVAKHSPKVKQGFKSGECSEAPAHTVADWGFGADLTDEANTTKVLPCSLSLFLPFSLSTTISPSPCLLPTELPYTLSTLPFHLCHSNMATSTTISCQLPGCKVCFQILRTPRPLSCGTCMGWTHVLPAIT